MILVDVNLLLYAVNKDLPGHNRARMWFEQTLSGTERVGLPWVVLLAFLRITTNKRVFENPLPIESAVAYIDEWLQQPVVNIIGPGQGHWNILRNLLFVHGTGGNLTTDVHIAALAIEYGAQIYSADNDFKRFSGIRHVNPIVS
ncbi:MAG: type II toxin-antitoxin system VapC family toxin [Desulfovermiculus sp.]|nr:type II toxin-antitoxin system VapC family toxin [Desulfovermiculus sp.]